MSTMNDQHQMGNSKLDPSNLSSAMGQPQTGRREDPVPEDPQVRRRRIIIGLIWAAVVVIVAFIVLMIVGQGVAFPEG